MPVRFQVDPDFYDHPKTYGMSDAAVALWTRAGSYSASKLTDGFIAEHVLALLSQTPREAAEELKRRGLWTRVKGGYQFHQWGERNLTKQRVQDDQKADRDRKRSARKAAGQNENSQHNQGIVRPESERNPDGIQSESQRIPGVSVSVSLSESVSGSGRDADGGSGPPGAEPPSRCLEHIRSPSPPPCRECGDARKAHEQWQIDRARWDRDAPRCGRHPAQRAHNCPTCRSERLGTTND